MKMISTACFYFLMIITACVVLLASAGHSAADQDAQKIIDSVEKTVKKLETITCTFRQEYEQKAFEKTRVISGTICTKTPNMLRVEYPAQTIVVDGETVWQYIPKNRQVTVQEFEEGEDMFPTPHSIFIRHIARGEAVFEGEEEINGRICDKLHLSSGLDESSEVTVWVDRTLKFPVKTVETKPNGDVITYVLDEVKLNKRINNKTFKFIVPEGVEVVDMRG